jgi:hypothetical protein
MHCIDKSTNSVGRLTAGAGSTLMVAPGKSSWDHLDGNGFCVVVRGMRYHGVDLSMLPDH